MSSIITSLKDLVTSVFEVIFSVFNTAIDMVSGLVMGLVNSVIGVVKMALHTVGNFLEAAGGVGKFVASKSCSLSWSTVSSADKNVNRQHRCHRTYRWRYIRLSTVSRSPRSSR